MKSLIFRTASSYLLPLLLLFAVFILLRGHYLPGGGFVGGLIASIAFVLHSLGHGLKETRKIIKFHPGYLMPLGLSIAVSSGIIPLFLGQPILTGIWFDEPFPIVGMMGSALFFDTGVFLVVIGATLTILFTITETI
ncbi:MAG: Na+/H+ antiporter subunit B [Anditalea sp.]